MTDLNTMSDEALKVIETVQKLLNLASRNPNQAEAAAAAAKAQSMLAAHNLEMSAVEEVSGVKSGRREKAKALGGMYEYQRDLWRAVCDLNFCMYWNQMVWVHGKVQRYDSWEGRYYTTEDWYKSWEHRIVGRMVNTTASRLLGQYLEKAIEDLLMEHLRENYDKPNTQRFSSWAVAFREGAVSNITTRLYERREQVLDEERKRREAELDRMAQGFSTDRALTLADYAQAERDANVDFAMGEEGYSARKRAEREAAAEAAAEAEKAYAKWAAENPEEAAKEEAKRAEEERKRWSRYRGGSSGPTRASDKNPGAWSEGRRAGAKISIDRQMGGTSAPRSLK